MSHTPINPDLTPKSDAEVAKNLAQWIRIKKLAEDRRIALENAATEKRMMQLEIDKLNLDIHDMRDKVLAAETAYRKAVETRVKAETLLNSVQKPCADYEQLEFPSKATREFEKSLIPQKRVDLIGLHSLQNEFKQD